MPSIEERIESLERQVERAEKELKKARRTRKSRDEKFIEWDKKGKERFLKTPQEDYSAEDLVYYFRLQCKRARRPAPIFTFATFQKAKKHCEALLSHLSVSRCCGYIRYVVRGQADIENPTIFVLTSGWSQKWLCELKEWLLDEAASKWVEQKEDVVE